MKKHISFVAVIISLIFSACTSKTPEVKIQKLDNFPLHYVGLVPGANCQTKCQLDLFEDKTYFLRTICLKNDLPGKHYDDIGRWHIDETSRLILRGGREAPQFFQVQDKKTLVLMDLKGKEIKSKLDYKLTASQSVKTLEPRVFMSGMYSYMADAAIFRECITGVKYPVAFEEDNVALQRAYLKLRKTPGESLKVYIDGKIVVRKGMDSNVLEPTLLVKKFINIIPKEVCQHLGSKANLENTYWKLTLVNGKAVAHTQSTIREAHMVLSGSTVRGNSGCNGFGGKYILDADKLSFSDKGFAMTRMFCQNSPEAEFLKALRNMSTYKINGEYLEIFDKNGNNLARFESVYLY